MMSGDYCDISGSLTIVIFIIVKRIFPRLKRYFSSRQVASFLCFQYGAATLVHGDIRRIT